MSCLDDIPEDRELSGKSSEEKELTRVDSGLGEWDSESSRKTSFSSQGRLSPDFTMDKPSKVNKFYIPIGTIYTPQNGLIKITESLQKDAPHSHQIHSLMSFLNTDKNYVDCYYVSLSAERYLM